MVKELARLCPLFSGSRGNSTYIGSSGVGILVDAGRSAKQIEVSLRENNINVDSIKAIFVTHEHTDHIQGVRVLASRYGIKVFASSGTMSKLGELGVLNGKFPYEVVTERGVEIAGMFVRPFKTPHDSIESVGYSVNTADGKRAVIATDIGYMSDVVRSAIQGSDAAVIESNHDVKMLQNGSYPYYLKRRILSQIGHLSNEACALELPFFINSGTRNFVLAHLSAENNIPELAHETAVCKLSEHGMKLGYDFNLCVAPKENFGERNIIF